MEILDISRTIIEGMPVWPGDEKYHQLQTSRISRGDSYNLSGVSMSLHAGTHLDAPLHFLESGADITGVSLDHCLGSARVMDVVGEPRITASVLSRLDFGDVCRVLFKTGAPEVPGDAFDPNFVFLADDAADFLAQKELILIGIDSPSIDAFDSNTHHAHKTLLSRGIAVLEGLRLTGVEAGDYELVCLPLKFLGADGSPVRAILRR